MTANSQKVYVKNYGCQMNVYDGQKMADLLKPHGYAITETPEDADVAILNTCHIREKAEHKVFSDLGRLSVVKKNGITLCRTANLLNDKKEIDESAHSFYKTAITDLREKLKKDNRYIANMEWTEDQVSGDLCLYITTNPLPLERHKNNE